MMDLLRKLNVAVKAGDEEAVREAVASGASYDKIFGMAGTALCQAINCQHKHIVAVLIELGCDVNAPDFDGGFPLSLAIRKHYSETALTLIDVPSCDLNHPDPVIKKPPLCAAVVEGLVEVVERLVQDPRCNTTAGDKDGNSALHLAILHQKREMVSILARCEGYRHLHNKAGLAPIHQVAQLGDCQLFDLLYPAPARKEEAYHHMMDEGDVPCAATVATVQREVNQLCTYTADTALHLAVREGHVELMERLIQLGVAMDKVNNSGQTVLLTACAQTSDRDVTSIARRLLEAGTPPSVAGALRLQQQTTVLAAHARESRLTPLHVAASFGNQGLVSVLCEFGADVNACDERGRSPLYLALVNGSGEVARFLLHHTGENIDVRTGTRMRGDTLLHAVCQCQSHAEEITGRLISLGCPMDTANSCGNTPLHDAISFENVGVVRELLERGANPSIRGGEGSLPLQLAARTGNVVIGRLLLSAGADINGREGYEDITEEELEDLSPLQEALQSEMLQFAHFLVEAGCDVPKDAHLFDSLSDDEEEENDDDDSSDLNSIDGGGDRNANKAAPEWLKKNLEFRLFLLARGSNPQTLLKLCLDAVRKCFRSSDPPFSYMAALPLPEKMIDLLFYRTN